MQAMDDLIWKMFDTFHIDFPEEPIASMERFSPMRFYREKHVFRMGDFSNRIIELANITELPTGSILHILDDVAFPEAHSDLPRIADNIFLQKESFQKKYIYHMRDLNLEGPVMVDDKFIFRPAGLPSIFMKFRSEHKAFFRYLNTLAEAPSTKECLVIVNHNPLFRTQVFGRYRFFRKLQLILASILNTTHQLQHLDKQQFIQIPWGEEVFDKQLFVRTRTKLDPIVLRRPDSFHFIMMMHLLNFMWEESDTSIFRQLPAEDFRQLNLIIQMNDKYLFFNMADLLRLNEKNRAHVRFCNQLNTLSLVGRTTLASSEVKAEADKFIKKVSEDTAPESGELPTSTNDSAIEETSVVKEEFVPRITDGAPITEPITAEKLDTDADKKAEEVIRNAAVAIPITRPAIPKTTVSVEIPQTHTTVKEVTAGKIKEIAPKVVLNATAIRTADTSKDSHAHEYIHDIDKDTDIFIDSREELTPKEKNRYKIISQKYKSLQLGGESLETILRDNNDITLEDDDIDPKLVGDLPDPSSLKSSITKFDKTYMDKTFKKHLVGAAISFQKSGVFLTGIKETKEVSEMNNVTHYSLHYEDIEGRQSTVKFRFPTVDAEGKVLIDGVKQVLKKQRVALPIVKISDTEISLASNQNKTRVIRNENRAHNYFSFIDSLVNSSKSTATIEFGSCQVNIPLSYEYSSLADRYRRVSFKNKETYELYFDYKTRLSHFGGTEEVLQKLEKVYGVYTGSTAHDWLFIDNQNRVRAVKKSGGEDIEFPYSSLLEIFRLSLRDGESFTKTLSEWISIKILDKQLPVIFVLAYRYGLRNILDYMGIKYRVTEGRSKIIVGESGMASFDNTEPGALHISGMESLEEAGLRTIKSGYVYHLSHTDLGASVLMHPRIPDSSPSLEEHTTKRVCVSNSVQGCIIAIPDHNADWNSQRKKMLSHGYIYAIRKSDIPSSHFVDNSEIVKKRLVFDANITEESWITQPVLMKRVGEIEYGVGDQDSVVLRYKPLRTNDEMKKWAVYEKDGYLRQYAHTYTWLSGMDPAGGPKTYNPKRHLFHPAIAGVEAIDSGKEKQGIISEDAISTLQTEGHLSSDKRHAPSPNDITIKFADRTIWINRYPLAHSLIVAGLEAFDLTMHTLAEFESKDVYFQLLQEKKCSANYLKGIDAFFETFIDNMTFSTLKMMKEPTTVKDLLLRCATLLSTLDYRPPSSRMNFRIRGYEQFNAILYNEMARQYAAYKSRRGKANTFSINPDAVFLRIIQNASMVPSESVNPLQDIKETSYMTYAGVGGRTADSFVITDRKYSADDIGIISEATVDNQKVGINAQLSMDPGIMNTMGVLEPKPLEELKPANVLSAHALVFPFSTHDDSKRINFISIQSTHMVPTTTVDMSRVRTGYERVVAHRVGRTFAGMANQDGKVTNIDEKAKLVEVTYQDGKSDIFSYGEQYTEFQGFNVTQDLVSVVKLGQKVKKGDVITYNKGFFTRDPLTGQLDMSIGILANVALMENDTTLEDSTEISKRLSEKLTMRPTNTRTVTLTRKSIIHQIKAVGDHVLNTDHLVVFEEEPLDGINTFNMDDAAMSVLADMNRDKPTAKFNGEIVAIEAYYGCPISEMHPSLSLVVKSAIEQKNRRSKMAAKTDRMEEYPPSGIMTPGSKFKGVMFDEDTVCLVFYIQEDIPHDKGDKLVLMNQLKCTCAGIFPKEITSESGTPIDIFFSADGIYRRCTMSPMLYGVLARIVERMEEEAVKLYFE